MRNRDGGGVSSFSKSVFDLGPKPTVVRRCFVRPLHGLRAVGALSSRFSMLRLPVVGIDLSSGDPDLMQQSGRFVEAGKASRLPAAGLRQYGVSAAARSEGDIERSTLALKRYRSDPAGSLSGAELVQRNRLEDRFLAARHT